MMYAHYIEILVGMEMYSGNHRAFPVRAYYRYIALYIVQNLMKGVYYEKMNSHV